MQALLTQEEWDDHVSKEAVVEWWREFVLNMIDKNAAMRPDLLPMPDDFGGHTSNVEVRFTISQFKQWLKDNPMPDK